MLRGIASVNVFAVNPIQQYGAYHHKNYGTQAHASAHKEHHTGRNVFYKDYHQHLQGDYRANYP